MHASKNVTLENVAIEKLSTLKRWYLSIENVDIETLISQGLILEKRCYWKTLLSKRFILRTLLFETLIPQYLSTSFPFLVLSHNFAYNVSCATASFILFSFDSPFPSVIPLEYLLQEWYSSSSISRLFFPSLSSVNMFLSGFS